MEDVFYSEERGDDVIKWAKNIDAICWAMSSLAFHDELGDWAVKRFTQIMSDYARAIQETAEEAHLMLNKYFDNRTFSRSLAERYERMREWFPEHRLEEAQKAIEEASKFLEEASQVRAILEQFKAMAQEASDELDRHKKKASAREKGKTEAFFNTGPKPESVVSVAN